MLARYLLSSCVRPPVHPSVTSRYYIETTGRIELVRRFPSTHPTLRYKKKWVSQKYRVLPSGTLFQTSVLENLPLQAITLSLTRRRCGRRSSLLTTPVRQSTSRGCFASVYYKSINRNPLTPSLRFGVDLLYNFVFIVDKILTAIARRAVRLRQQSFLYLFSYHTHRGWFGCRVVSVLDSDAERPGFKSLATLSGNSLRQTVHTHCASVHQAAKLVADLLRVAG